MKRKLLLSLLGILIGLPILARDFTYEGLKYTVLSESEGTVETLHGTRIPMADEAGNKVSGSVVVPATVYDGNGASFTVTGLAYMSFINRPQITALTLPSTITEIGEYAMNNVGITEIIIPSSVEKIGTGTFLACDKLQSANVLGENTEFGNGVFKNCPELRTVTISGVRELTAECFYNCPLLEEVTLPSALTSVGKTAFYNCQSLSVINLYATTPPSVNESAFSGASKFTLIVPVESMQDYIRSDWSRYASEIIPMGPIFEFGGVKYSILDSNTEATVCGYTEELPSELTIPAKVKNGNDEYTVSKIISLAFMDCSRLTEVTIPNSVTSIGVSAFSGCSNLSLVTMSNPITSIAKDAFSGIPLRKLTLESTKVPNFRDCFSAYSNSATLNVPEEAFVDYLWSSWNVFRNISDGNQVSPVATDNSLDYHIFKSTASGEVRNEAILIPGSYENLSSVDILDGITVNDEKYYITGISSKAFSGCKNLTSVTFNARTEIERIGASAFYDCTGLTKVDYPSLERLCNIYFESGSSNPLYYAHNLYINGVETKDVEIPTDIKEIKAYAFTGCTLNSAKYTSLEQLCSIDFGSRSSNPLWLAHDLYIGGKGIRKLEIPTSIKEIKAYAFAGATIYTVVIPNSVMTIGKDAFADCTELETVRFEDGATPLDLFADAFQYYKDNKTYYQVINDLYLGRNIANRTALWSKNLVIGNLVTEFYNFKDNKNLVSLTLGSGLTAIPADAFNGCSLSEVVVPVNVTEIGENAFANNNGKLTKVSMGYKLTTIGEKAFDRNTIETVNVAATTPPEASDNTFSNYKGMLYVPSGSEEEYRYAMNCWHNFARYPLVDLEKIEGSADKLSGQIGETVQLSATLTPENLSLPYVFWRSTNPELAIVDNNGLVTIVGGYELGECKIIAETLYDTDKVATFDVKSLSAGIFEIVAEEGFEEFGGSDVERANDIFTLEGVCLKRNASKEDIDALAPGIYIVAGKKMVVK